jgi:phosphotransferase system enzyme I (PtsI)
MAPTLPHGVWSLDVPQPEATALRAVRMCAGISAAALSPSGGALHRGGPVPRNMTFSVHGIPVARGMAIGRAVLVASSRLDVAHYFIESDQVESEIDRVRAGRNAVVDELQRLQQEMPKDAPHELAALLDVHLMLLQDEALTSGVKHWIRDRLYNAEWALTTQLEVVSRQFDEMEDEYLRERKADLEQVVERVLRA